MYIGNHYSQCLVCKKRWWIVDIPVFGICDVCEEGVIRETLDFKATLNSKLQERPKLLVNGEEVPRPQMDADASEQPEGEADCDVALEDGTDEQIGDAPLTGNHVKLQLGDLSEFLSNQVQTMGTISLPSIS